MRNDDARAAWEYHRCSSLTRADPDAKSRTLDWANQPRPYKLYPRLAPIPLPDARAQTGVAALDALAAPDPGHLASGVLDVATLASILHYSAGIVRRVTLPGTGREQAFRAASCTGALYHVDVYLVGGPLDGLAPGVYQFGPQDHALRLLRPGDWRASLVEACADQEWVKKAPVALVLTTTYWRNAWRYDERAYRHAFWDCGTILANVLDLATAHGLPAGVVTGFVDRAVNRLLDLDAQKEVALAVVPLGYNPDVSPFETDPVSPIGLRTAVYSAAEIDYPAIRAVHAASSLSHVEEVRAWRSRGQERRFQQASASGPIRLLVREGSRWEQESNTLEASITARGSARRFDRAPISPEALGAVLRAARRRFRADYRAALDDSLVDWFVLVNAVDGLDSGLYRCQPGAPAVQPLAGLSNSRAVAGRLVLDEHRGADAAAIVLLLADLPRILGRLGNRGYRAGQLEAGILTGKVYLAATQAGLGVTGLTFYDDEVCRIVKPYAPDHHPMLAVAVGHRA